MCHPLSIKSLEKRSYLDVSPLAILTSKLRLSVRPALSHSECAYRYDKTPLRSLRKRDDWQGRKRALAHDLRVFQKVLLHLDAFLIWLGGAFRGLPERSCAGQCLCRCSDWFTFVSNRINSYSPFWVSTNLLQAEQCTCSAVIRRIITTSTELSLRATAASEQPGECRGAHQRQQCI